MSSICKILVVDDSDVDRQHVVKILKNAGYTVFEANSGEAGIRKAVEVQPDLVLMDVMMPEVNGFQATRHLRKMPETANIPIFMLTARRQYTDKIWAMKQGASCFLVKPADSSLLLNEIVKLQTCIT